VIAFKALVDPNGPPATLKTMLEQVSQALGNTPAIARKSYIHPALIELAQSGDKETICAVRLPRATKYLSGAERGLIAFLDTLAESAEQIEAQAA
jgi:DNA topoisomerase-1